MKIGFEVAAEIKHLDPVSGRITVMSLPEGQLRDNQFYDGRCDRAVRTGAQGLPESRFAG